MTELKTNVSDAELREITTPSVLFIMKTIKQIQKRMKDPDIARLEYIIMYDTLGKEFNEFFENYTGIFIKVIRGENLSTVASALYYKDKIERGLMTQDQLSDMLATKYLPANLKAEADAKIREMKEKETSGSSD